MKQIKSHKLSSEECILIFTREKKNTALFLGQIENSKNLINERINTETHLRKLVLQNEQKIKMIPSLLKEVTNSNGFKQKQSKVYIQLYSHRQILILQLSFWKNTVTQTFVYAESMSDSTLTPTQQNYNFQQNPETPTKIHFRTLYLHRVLYQNSLPTYRDNSSRRRKR